jgi:hypothetical protein
MARSQQCLAPEPLRPADDYPLAVAVPAQGMRPGGQYHEEGAWWRLDADVSEKPAEDDGLSAVLGASAERSWRPGRHFGRRVTRVPPLPRPPAPLYTAGTAVRIERLRLLDLRGDVPVR